MNEQQKEVLRETQESASPTENKLMLIANHTKALEQKISELEQRLELVLTGGSTSKQKNESEDREKTLSLSLLGQKLEAFDRHLQALNSFAADILERLDL